ncbi:MAG: hypothetical protein HY951_04355 [Bacteroidia bacterium]|nr:hypothetical protein [Bacteroidia bacterium]
MKTINIILFSLFLTQLTNAYAQEFTNIVLKSCDTTIISGYTKRYKSFDNYNFTVNNIPLSIYDNSYKIPISESKLDTITIKITKQDTVFVDLVYTKFKANKQYVISCNRKTGYAIYDIDNKDYDDFNKKDSLYNFVRFNFKNIPRHRITIGGFISTYLFCSEFNKNNKPTHYFRDFYDFPFNPAAYNITFRSKRLFKIDNWILKKSVSIQYLHSEKYTIEYDLKTNQVNVTLDGYFDKTKDVVIDGTYILIK